MHKLTTQAVSKDGSVDCIQYRMIHNVSAVEACAGKAFPSMDLP